MVHHQVDWAIGKYIVDNKLGRIRTFTCSHLGKYDCGVMREFSNSGKEKQICKTCQKSTNSYFREFKIAENISNELKIILDIDSRKNKDIAKVKDYVRESIWYNKLKGEMKELVEYLFDNIQHIADLTIQTHIRISKCDLGQLSTKDRLMFSKTLLIEGLRVIQNWAKEMPYSILLFNGRLSPYSVISLLAKKMKIKIVFHERGDYYGYMFCENSVPSAGEYVHDYIEKYRRKKNIREIKDGDILNALTYMNQNIKRPANFPDLFNSGEKVRVEKGDNKKSCITYIVSSDDEADCTIESNLGERQRNIIRILCEMGIKQDNLTIHIKVHPNIVGCDHYPGMKQSYNFYKNLSKTYDQFNNIFVHLTKDVDPFELVNDSDIVIGLHSTVVDYAWFRGKTIITDTTAISRYLTPLSIDFMNQDEVVQAINDVLSNTMHIRSLADFKEQLDYIYLKINGFCLDLGSIGLADDYFSPKNRKEEVNLNKDRIFLEGANKIANALLHKNNINQEILG